MRKLRVYLARFRAARYLYRISVRAYLGAKSFAEKRNVVQVSAAGAKAHQKIVKRLRSRDENDYSLLAFLIDFEFIGENYPDISLERNEIARAILDGQKHMAIDPNQHFDADFYASKYSKDLIDSGLSPLVHYFLYGRKKGYYPNPVSSYPFSVKSNKLHLQRELSLVYEYLFAPQKKCQSAAPAISLEDETLALPSVAVIVPTFNNWQWTERCLRSIKYSGDVRMEQVWVADDCSQDETNNLIELRFPGVNVIKNDRNLGFLQNCNKAFEMTEAYDYVFILNNDTEVTPGFLRNAMLKMGNDPQVGLVASKLMYPDGLIQDAGGIIWSDGSGWNFGRSQKDESIFNTYREIDYGTGAAILIRRNAVGEELFDEQFTPAYYEDTDLSFRLRSRGYKVMYAPCSVVIHHEGKSHGTDTSSGIKSYQDINKVKFRNKWIRELQNHKNPDPLAVNQAAFRLEFTSRTRTVLWVDYQAPDPTRDSGSVRALALMNIFRRLGFFIVFIPENKSPADVDLSFLQNSGVLMCNSINEANSFLKASGRQPDVVLTSRVYTSANLGLEAKKLYPSAKFIFDTVDLHFLRLEREFSNSNNPLDREIARSTRESELALIRKADVTFVVSEFEKQLLSEIEPKAIVEVVSNIHSLGVGSPREDRRGLIFVGSFKHHPNEDGLKWFLNEVWGSLPPVIHKEGLRVVGQNPPEWLGDFAHVGVQALGWVPDSGKLVGDARVSIAPLRVGAGVKGKVGEAISHLTPIVGTSIAVEGMGLENNESCLIADDPVQFARSIETLFFNQELQEKTARAASEVLAKQFEPEIATNNIIRALARIDIE